MRDDEGRAGRGDRGLSGLSHTRPAYAAAMAIFMFSLAGIPPLFGFWPKLLVFQAAVNAGLVALAVAAIVGTVVGAYYYLRSSRSCTSTSRRRAFGRVRQPVQGALIFLAAVARVAARLSADRPAQRAHRPRRGIDLLTRIRIVERTGSTNADLLADPSAVEGDWLVALAQDAGRGRQGREWVSEAGNFFGSTLGRASPGDPLPHRCRWSQASR